MTAATDAEPSPVSFGAPSRLTVEMASPRGRGAATRRASDDDVGVSFLARPVPASFDLGQVILEAGTERPFERAEWDDTFVVVEAGRVELEAIDGGCRTFGQGDMLCLGVLRLRCLRNRGAEPVVLSRLRRCRRPPARAGTQRRAPPA